MKANSECRDARCGCAGKSDTPQGWGRREFLKVLGLTAGVFAVNPRGAMAGPFTRADFESLVPSDKKLRPEWIRSLTARGEREVYRGPDLEKIGMPIGGIYTGQLYLGGDGRLWHWDIFNHHIRTGAEHYATPLKATSPLSQGFALRVTANDRTQERALDAAHWRDVSFIGEYPIGYVDYRDPECPATVHLEAFSPFVPLNTEDSSLPATVLDFTVTNTGTEALEVELAGWLENAVCLYSAQNRDGFRRNRLLRHGELLFLECTAEDVPDDVASGRPDIVYDDFEGESYGNWAVTGTAFGTGPIEISQIPTYQGNVEGTGQRVVNSHASAPGDDVIAKDQATGRLTSRPFTIERNYITFLVGGGNHEGRTCVNLVVGDEVVLSTTGQARNRMDPVSWDVRSWMGRTAQLVIVDEVSGRWGNIGVDDIIFSDRPRKPPGPLAEQADYGTMGLGLLNPQPGDFGSTAVANNGMPRGIFSSNGPAVEPTRRPFSQQLAGSVTRKFSLAPGQTGRATFLITWHMPNLKMDRLPPGRHYAARFTSARSVANHVARHFEGLQSSTRLWHDTWYDSTLPHWFLDRMLLNASILASSTCHRFGNGRFYGWEGVGCCAGTCDHVWQYAHSVARLFPELERLTREKVDFGLALQPDGAIHFRGEFNNIPAVDGQAGTILRALREHQMSADDTFLKHNWPRIKLATRWLIAKDGNNDGLIEGNQHNTLDADWYGPVAWLSGLYLAALRAAAQMATEVGDTAFATQCLTIAETGQRNLVANLFEVEYFMNKPDPKHPGAINSGTGCHIDQVLGQSWAFQVGLPRVLPEEETHKALRSLWRYNFTPDVGPYRKAYKAGRWYAMPGEAGLLMCTFPRTDWDYDQARGRGAEWAAGYFNECMNGFEYQVAGHMIWEGEAGSDLVEKGLSIARAVHDRYHPSRRNPWNEVECGDHYARSMASHGVYLAACGYEYHGPKGHLGFAPRISPEKFKAAFTAAEGWGTYSQEHNGIGLKSAIALKWGRLRLNSLALELPKGAAATSPALTVTLAGKAAPAQVTMTGRRALIRFEPEIELIADQALSVTLA